ncbi:hypothetical protein BC831DRAFT_511713 [Entophlyctis helioformis]|nr:hypothetical protein BC831DRAFT_511713 [Entophlyctis helioformis]
MQSSSSTAVQPTVRVDDKDGMVHVGFPDGKAAAFHGIWLRDHCRCSECFHEITKQRLVDTSSIPLDIRPSSASIAAGSSLVVQWSGPSHTSVFPLAWLHDHAYAPKLASHDVSLRRDYKLWGADLAGRLPTTPYDEIMAGDAGLAKWLNNIDEYGVGFVSGVPANPKDTEALARRVSFIRETHYGGFWDFSPNLEHGDTAYTSIALPAHTDTTYFTDPIGLQMFHLLEHRGEGGESLYVDGFRVASQLKERSRWAYDALTQIKISAHSAGDKNTLMQPTPFYFSVINLDPADGNPLQIRFNNDDRSVLDHLSAGDVRTFYAALREWTLLLRAKDNELWVRLQPGTVAMVDNWRVLHGRAAFTGFRRLIGSYHGWDDFRSRVKMVCHNGRDKDRI